MRAHKKGISPVVATALLLVVAVVAIVGFETWYNTYSSGINSEIESKSLYNEVTIEKLVDGMLYLKSNRNENVTVKEVIINDDSYSFNENISDIKMIDISTGIENAKLYTSTADITVITDNGVTSKSFLIRN